MEDTNMTKAIQSVKRFLVEENGPTAVEYAVLLGLIIIAAIGAVSMLGTSLTTFFGNASEQVPTGEAGAAPTG